MLNILIFERSAIFSLITLIQRKNNLKEINEFLYLHLLSHHRKNKKKKKKKINQINKQKKKRKNMRQPSVIVNEQSHYYFQSIHFIHVLKHVSESCCIFKQLLE